MAKQNKQAKSVRKLNKRQLAVVNDVFENQLSEEEILEKHGVSKTILKKWFEDPAFIAEIDFRVDSARRQSKMIIARYGPVAAAKLVQLTESEKEETARKACLDVIAAAGEVETKKAADREQVNNDSERLLLTESLASRLLEVLAQENTKRK